MCSFKPPLFTDKGQSWTQLSWLLEYRSSYSIIIFPVFCISLGCLAFHRQSLKFHCGSIFFYPIGKCVFCVEQIEPRPKFRAGGYLPTSKSCSQETEWGADISIYFVASLPLPVFIRMFYTVDKCIHSIQTHLQSVTMSVTIYRKQNGCLHSNYLSGCVTLGFI